MSCCAGNMLPRAAANAVARYHSSLRRLLFRRDRRNVVPLRTRRSEKRVTQETSAEETSAQQTMAQETFGRDLSPFPELTPREREVLVQIAGGSSNEETGRHLGISPRTIEVHRARIMAKLGAKNAADLVRIVLSQDRGH